MLYLEDYLELIEHLPQELRDRLTYVRESDLRVNNSSLQIEARVSKFFADAKDLTEEQRQCEYEAILQEYQKTSKFADDKVDVTTQTHDIMLKLVDRLNGELEKFKLELEADHAGITEELERRSLELDSDSRLDGIINNHLNNQLHNAGPSGSMHSNHHNKHSAASLKDRRKSEHKHHYHQRIHPYNQDNGYHKRAKLSQNEFIPSSSVGSISTQYPQTNDHIHRIHPATQSRQNSAATSPAPLGSNLFLNTSAPASVVDGDYPGGGHYSNNLSSFGNNASFIKDSCKNLQFNQHSALSAALSSTTPTPHQLNSVSALAMLNASNSSQGNKISFNDTSGLKGNSDIINSNYPLVRQNPFAAAASQAIAATQQLQQGRRTPSLKASFAAVNAAGLNQIDSLSGPGSTRNALAPVAPDQQSACRYNNYGKINPNPLYIPVTKSGRPSKRPKHRASHAYPDESPPSISSDNSVFENSESLSSAEYLETGTTFDSVSPSSLDFNSSVTVDQSSADPAVYQRDDTKYCICRQISYGEMVACDNEACEIEWFHYDCVGVTQPPKGKWFCPDCSRKMDPNQSLQKKRGRKEKSVFNMVQNSPETPGEISKDIVTK